VVRQANGQSGGGGGKSLLGAGETELFFSESTYLFTTVLGCEDIESPETLVLVFNSFHIVRWIVGGLIEPPQSAVCLDGNISLLDRRDVGAI